MFAKVLVANRGEIACRVMRTLRSRRVASVAVFHHVDRDAPHVAMADERAELTANAPLAAYLDAHQIVDVATRLGADAIHPGYGFLSENPSFSALCEERGVRFIGPGAEIMRLMGDKIRARGAAAQAGVSISHGIVLEGTGADAGRAAELGFPLLVKAAAGGGGKGMRVVRAATELAAHVALAQSEARRSFGDGRVYAERLLHRPRHVEVQVLGDGRGHVVHLGARDCSIQRRYQKIIEESPAPGLPSALYEQIVSSAVRIASFANYENAGTVEFIVGEDGTFHFLEMNTRLQVEHPVTEMTTGIDLVDAQLRIADARALPFTQADVRFDGHAIECRVCAEEPEHDFRPATGRVGVLVLPRGDGMRVDCGIRAGQRVTAAFDSLLMKIVTHGASRAHAIERMDSALRGLTILGVATNVDALRRIIGSSPFASGAVHTGFLEQNAIDIAPTHDEEMADVAAIAASLRDAEMRRAIDDVPEPYASIGAFRN